MIWRRFGAVGRGCQPSFVQLEPLPEEELAAIEQPLM